MLLFRELYDFIKDAAGKNKGQKLTGMRALIYSRDGKSRAPALGIGYLVADSQVRLREAYEHVRLEMLRVQNKKLEINEGFKFQLANFELELHEGVSSVSDQNSYPSVDWDFAKWNAVRNTVRHWSGEKSKACIVS
jgi:hypothetical protein